MGRLDGQIALVAGGAGNIGIGIVKVFMQQGATVIVPSRGKDRLKELEEYVADVKTGRLISEITDISDFHQALALADKIVKEHGRIDIAIASLGGWYVGPDLSETDISAWDMVLRGNITSHFVLARAVMPQLQKQGGGTYVALGGPGNVTIIPNCSLMHIMGLSQIAMAELFAIEARRNKVNYYQLFIAQIATREAFSEHVGEPGWIVPEDVGEHLVKLHYREVEKPAQFMQKFMRATFPILDRAIEYYTHSQEGPTMVEA